MKLNIKSVLAGVSVTIIALGIGLGIFLSITKEDAQSPRAFVAQFLDDLNALNHGDVCKSLAPGAGVSDDPIICAQYETLVAAQTFMFGGSLPHLILSEGKVSIGPHNVYSVPILETEYNQNGYADIQRAPSGEWKLIALRST